jgi:hypothetical protein
MRPELLRFAFRLLTRSVFAVHACFTRLLRAHRNTNGENRKRPEMGDPLPRTPYALELRF